MTKDKLSKSNIKPALVIMAAGMGSRYGGLKQIDPVTDAGEILLDFSLYDAMMAGYEDVIFIIRKEHEKDFRALLDERAGKYMNIRYAFQDLADLPKGYSVPEGRSKPWGTCHAVMSARDMIDGPFTVINADDYYGPSAFMEMYSFLEEESRASNGVSSFAMVGYDLYKTLSESGHVARGVCAVDESGYLEGIVERTKIMALDHEIAYEDESTKQWVPLDGKHTVSMNFWGFTRAFMDEIIAGYTEFLDKILATNPLNGEYFLPEVVEKMILAGTARVKVLKSSDRWYGMTYQEDKPGVTAALQSMKDRGIYPEKLWK